MTEKDLDIAIEKCERIMEFDTRTLKNPESENGWIFEKVYELLKYLRQFQFATDTNVATTDTISRAAAINAICEDGTRIERQGWYSMTMVERKQRDVDILENLPSAQQWIPCSERMPFVDEYGKSDQVLATCGLQGAETSSIRWLRILYFNGCNWCFPTGESYEQMVYAWMPLPKPAKIEV